MTIRHLAALCAALVAAPVAQQRSVPTISLDNGAKEFAEAFTEIRGMVELPDGRVLLFDYQEKEIRLVDLTAGTMTPATRTGAGPLEFNPVGMFLSGASDSAVYYDIAQRRFLLFSPAGAPVRTISLGESDPRAMITQAQPIAVDAAGMVYGQSMGMSIPAEGTANPVPTFLDSVVIVRRDIRSGRADTIARARAPLAQSQPRMSMTGSAIKMIITAPSFRAADTWAVLPDGRVAILRNGDYRVRFVKPRVAETPGPLVPHTLIPLTAAMRREAMDSARSKMDAALKQMNKQMGEMRARAGAAGGDMEMPSVQMDVVEPESWATHLPPYAAIQSSPDGMLWVTVMKSVGDAVGNYDVLDGTGALVARVKLAAKEKLVGLGRGTVYTVRTDSDDLQHLRRYTVTLRR